ncbi:putative clathrin heavy chain protein 1 [Xenorhabdus nematophila F1]|uniref:Clathrin heavy chain protein 1 n=1 Tax=Xenorhabdus nematophila (strain ATCC 19061 / DSM 3370 / CCUG 14189 / LMG 1036 / NCIMB 9965 / AN6) TaxID=406817 RepID=D3VDF2_XENNA
MHSQLIGKNKAGQIVQNHVLYEGLKFILLNIINKSCDFVFCE